MAKPIQELDAGKIKGLVKDNSALIALSTIFLLALYIRYIPAQNMQYLQALDSYMAYRMSQHIAFEASLPVVDFMRYFPYAMPSYLLHQGNVFIPAIIYWMGPFLFLDYLSWAQLYPAFMGSLTVIIVYFIGKEAFDKVTGLSAAFFLATIAGVLHRNSAGFFQKEPTAIVFMLLSTYFFLRAWKRDEWISGIGSGLTLGIASITWGGSSMVWLLYPLTVGLMLWINEDIRSLVKAYTPTVLIAGVLAASINPGRFWITDTFFLANLGMLGFLWSRYLVEELNLLNKKYIPYYTPGLSMIGITGLALSPLYSNFVAENFIRLIRAATRTGGGGDVVGGTVAENTAVTIGQLSSQLGSVGASQAHFYMSQPFSTILQPLTFISGFLANINGTWPLAFLGVVFLSTSVLTMVLRKFDLVEEKIRDLTYFKIAFIVLLVWTIAFSMVFQGSTLFVAGPAILALVGSVGILYGLEELGEREISFEWYHLLIVVWAVANILATVSQSRLIFLASFPTAFMAGYMFSQVCKRINSMGDEAIQYLLVGALVLIADVVLVIIILSIVQNLLYAALAVVMINGLGLLLVDELKLPDRTSLSSRKLRFGLLAVVIGVTVFVNFASAYSSANNLGGSPNNLWVDNLEYLQEETDGDSVVLSWWDYGYHFQMIGERATVADGGNHGYYTSNRKITYPLADFFASENPEEHFDFLEKHSADYIVLDETMIGKYSAVSQIANRDNDQFDSMVQLSTDRNIQNSLSQGQDDEMVVRYTGQGLQAYVPVEAGETGIDIRSAPTLETRSGRGDIGCMLTDSGVEEFEDTEPMRLGSLGEVCIAENPYYSLDRSLMSAQSSDIGPTPARLALVPRSITDTTLVRLYLMDGYGLDFVEKSEEGSNGYVKTWEIDLEG